MYFHIMKVIFEVNLESLRLFCATRYLEPWHADVIDFLELRKNHGKEELRARDLFYALWIPDLFMKRVQENGNWTLFCPDQTKETKEEGGKSLQDLWGKEFEERYEALEASGEERVISIIVYDVPK